MMVVSVGAGTHLFACSYPFCVKMHTHYCMRAFLLLLQLEQLRNHDGGLCGCRDSFVCVLVSLPRENAHPLLHVCISVAAAA